MSAYEVAKAEIKAMSTKQLIEVWELTTNNSSEYIPTVRGWLMDEFEARFPQAFAEWIDSDNCADNQLKNYINAAEKVA